MAGYRLGLDIGSTTIKIVLIDDNDQILFERYRRHFSDVRGELLNLFKEIAEECGEYTVTSAITGSGGTFGGQSFRIAFYPRGRCRGTGDAKIYSAGRCCIGAGRRRR